MPASNDRDADAIPHRRGIAAAHEYTTVIRRRGNEWYWEGHKRVAGGAGTVSERFGPVVEFGGPYSAASEARAAADRWFAGIAGILDEPPESE